VHKIKFFFGFFMGDLGRFFAISETRTGLTACMKKPQKKLITGVQMYTFTPKNLISQKPKKQKPMRK
jgi:hypothetical protein